MPGYCNLTCLAVPPLKRQGPAVRTLSPQNIAARTAAKRQSNIHGSSADGLPLSNQGICNDISRLTSSTKVWHRQSIHSCVHQCAEAHSSVLVLRPILVACCRASAHAPAGLDSCGCHPNCGRPCDSDGAQNAAFQTGAGAHGLTELICKLLIMTD